MADHIQINDITPRILYMATGAQAIFTFPFAIFKTADLEVYLNGVKQATGFTIAGGGNSGGGSVTFAAAPASGTQVALRRKLILARTSDYQADGIIRAKTLNDELDYQVAATQQVAEEAGRAVKRSPTSPSTADLTLPEPVAGRGLKWAPDGLSLVNSDNDPDAAIGAAQQAAVDAAARADAAAASAAAAGIDSHAADLARQGAEQARNDAQAATEGKLSNDGSNAMVAPLRLTVVATPAAPAIGEVKVYAKADGKLYRRDSSGEQVVGDISADPSVITLTAATAVRAPALKKVDGTGGFSLADFDATGKYEQGRTKAWVNFNGTGTVTTRDSFNVSSLTDNGIGDYSVTYVVALANANYAISCTISEFAGMASAPLYSTAGAYLRTPTAGICRVNLGANTSSASVVFYPKDSDFISVSVLGDTA